MAMGASLWTAVPAHAGILLQEGPGGGGHVVEGGIGENKKDSDRSPNIILIVTDDQGIDASSIPFFPNQLDCRTPRLATLASSGRIFTNCRVNPKCSPTRAGLLTGRSAFHTGVVGVVNPLLGTGDSLELRDRASLQSHETTIPEVLQAAGYETLLVGKWHVGWSAMPRPETAQWYHSNQLALQQGFDGFVDYRDFLCPDWRCGFSPPQCDCPFDGNDDLITWSVDQTIEQLSARETPDAPYALFFWTVDPHIRTQPNTWWPVSESLLDDPTIYDMNHEVDRFRAVVEAMDHELFRMLLELGVIDAAGRYREESNTVVFFVADNGTPERASWFGPDHAKSSLYEGGVRVPMFVLGEGVPADGEAVSRLVSHQDFFATLADVAGISVAESPFLPRNSLSFADDIGWSDEALPQREVTVSSLALHPELIQHVAICDGEYKLVVPAGLKTFAPVGAPARGGLDRMTRIESEEVNLASLTDDNYLRLRAMVSDLWPSAVGEPLPNQVDVVGSAFASIDSKGGFDDQSEDRRVGHAVPADGEVGSESRLLIRFDSDAIARALANPNIASRNILKAELILRFGHDSCLDGGDLIKRLEYARLDADIAPIRIHPLTKSWTSETSWQDLESAEADHIDLGSLDLAPHIIPADVTDNLSTIPISRGTPISFGTRESWRHVIRVWVSRPEHNHGIVLRSDLIPELVPGLQDVTFRAKDLDDVRLRITFE